MRHRISAKAHAQADQKPTRKRLVALALYATLVYATPLLPAGCGQKGEPEVAATSETAQTDTKDAASTDKVAPYATLSDVFAADGEDMSSTFDERRYVRAFNQRAGS